MSAVEFPNWLQVAIEVLEKLNITDEVSNEVAGLIRKRCARAKGTFRA